MGSEHLTDQEIQSLVSGEKVDPKIRTHAANCLECRRAVMEYRRLFSALAEAPNLTLSPEFSDRVMSRLHKKRFESWELFFLPLCVVCGLIAVGLSINWTTFKVPFANIAKSLGSSVGRVFEPVSQFVEGIGAVPAYLISAACALILVALIDRTVTKWKRHGVLH